MNKVFISYSHNDDEIATDLYKRLTRDGIGCFLDKECIAWGDNWVLDLEKGLDECPFLVVLLTPEYCISKWGKLERTGILAEDASGVDKKILPLMLTPCTEVIPRFLLPIQHIDISTPEKYEKEYPRICKALGGVLPPEIEPGNRTLPPQAPLPFRQLMPYRSLGNKFVGRVEDIWKIYDILLNRQTVVIEGVGVLVGMGGIGKTQLAIEYVHRFGYCYPGGVFWCEADQGISNMVSQVAKAVDLKLEVEQSETEMLNTLWEKLNTSQPVLMVYDNFPEDQAPQRWLPSLNTIHVLLTTRRRDLHGYENVSVDILTPEEGLMLLNKGQREFGEDAKELVKLLGGLPLAIELAGYYLNEYPSVSINDLLSEIKSVGEIKALTVFSESYRNELPSGHEKEILATFQISWNALSESARQIAQFISLLAPAPVPRRLLERAFGSDSELSLEDSLLRSIGELRRFSIIELDVDNDPTMHRLLSAFIWSLLDAENTLPQSVLENVKTEMARSMDDHDQKSLRDLEKILPHADFLIEERNLGDEAESVMALSDSLLRHHWAWGRYGLSALFGRKALETAENLFEPGHPSIDTRQSNLALVLKDLGELEEARDLLRQALAADQKNLRTGTPVHCHQSIEPGSGA